MKASSTTSQSSYSAGDLDEELRPRRAATVAMDKIIRLLDVNIRIVYVPKKNADTSVMASRDSRFLQAV